MFVALRSPELPQLQSIASECTLILPSVSIANIGQLACDLLISSLKATKIGYLHSSYLQPIVANDADSRTIKQCTGRISLPVEVYYAETSTNQSTNPSKLIIIQQRSPVLRGFHGEYARELHQFINQYKFSSTIILSSDSIHQRNDAQIQHELNGQTVEIAWSVDPSINQWKEAINAAEQLGLNRMQIRSTNQSNDALFDSADQDQSADLSLHSIVANTSTDQSITPSEYPFDSSISGGGVTRWLWPLLQSSRTSLLVLHTAEGDNARESAIMAHLTYQYAQLISQQSTNQSINQAELSSLKLKAPLSWQFVFGKAPLASIY